MSRSDKLFVVKAVAPEQKEICFAIRREVFIEEQKVPAEIERDEYDEAAVHFIAMRGEKPVGVARVRLKDDGATAKVERIAVRKEARGTGVGRALVQAVEAAEEIADADHFILHGQIYAKPFYERLGYKAEGDIFEEGNLPHYLFRKKATASYKS